MKNLLLRQVAFAIVLIWVCAASPPTLKADDSAIVLEFAKATNHKAASKALRSLFVDKNVAEIRALSCDENTSIALQSRWEIFTRLDSASKKLQRIDDANSMHELIGFLEGRINMICPEWWRRSLIGIQRENPSRFSFSKNSLWPNEKYKSVRSFTYVPTTVTLTIDTNNEIADLLQNQERIFIPKDASKEIMSHPSAMMVTFPMRDSAEYFALKYHQPASFHLWRLDAQNENAKWRADVWGVGTFMDHEGPIDFYMHPVEVTANTKSVCVFGASPFYMYCEQFSAETGKPMLRWSTNY